MPKILFIVGMARSGSTLLTALLDRVDGFAGLGEAHLYWELAGSGRRCGCKRDLDACPLWGGLAREQAEREVDVAGMRDAFQRFVRPRPRSLLRNLRARRGGPGAAQRARYAEAMGDAYAWLAERTGAKVLVDSTKLPAAVELTEATGAEVCVVHLVRDPRAVGHSLGRRRLGPERRPRAGGPRYLAAVLRAAADWTLRNAYVELALRRRSGRYVRLRFEDLAREPRACLQRLLELSGGGDASDVFAAEGAVELGENHILTGDEGRFKRGRVEIAPQETWREQMPRYAQVAATLVAAPLLRLYGYPMLPGR